MKSGYDLKNMMSEADQNIWENMANKLHQNWWLSVN